MAWAWIFVEGLCCAEGKADYCPVFKVPLSFCRLYTYTISLNDQSDNSRSQVGYFYFR